MKRPGRLEVRGTNQLNGVSHEIFDPHFFDHAQLENPLT